MMQLLALVIAAFGVWLVLFPYRQVRRVERRIADGDDRFFVEQRTYRSYPFLRSPAAIRCQGVAMLILAGVGLLAG